MGSCTWILVNHLDLQQLPSLAAVEYDVEEALGLIIQLLNSAVLLGVGDGCLFALLCAAAVRHALAGNNCFFLQHCKLQILKK